MRNTIASRSRESYDTARDSEGAEHANIEALPQHIPASTSTLGGNPRGKPSSWALVGTVIAAFAAGGAALILHAWWLFWMCAGIVVLAIPAGKAIGIMSDTVIYADRSAHD